MKANHSRRSFLQMTAVSPFLGLRDVRADALPALRSLQIVVPVPPGAQPDLIARWLVDPMARRAGVPGTVLNRPGAAGAVAADSVLAASPETGSLLLGGLDHVAYSHLNSNRKALDPFVDFTPVGAVNRDTWVLVTGNDASIHSLAALGERSRREPLSYPSLGEGSTAHLLSARLCKSASIEAQHVPYRDSWMPDLIAGRVHFAVAPTPAVLAQIKSGRLRALATLTDDRLPLPGDPPAVPELGLVDLVFYGGLFLFAPAALAGHAQHLNRCLVEAMTEPGIARRYLETGIEPMPIGVDAAAKVVGQRLLQVDAMRLQVFGRTR